MKLCVLVCLLGIPSLVGATVRIFYLGVVEEEWDYAPSGQNNIDDRDPSEYIEHSASRIGSIYQKTVYRRFTDENFTTKVPREPYLGFIGPIIRVEVGDSVMIYVKNFVPNTTVSFHPHGLFYLKESEGALYADGTIGKDKHNDILVGGGPVVLQTWNVTDLMAPLSGDPDCIPAIYHSHINTPVDINSGLIGLIDVCRPGILNSNGERMDVDKELTIVLSVFDENLSHLYEDNLDKCGDPVACRSLVSSGDEEFLESNLMHAINGYVYGNMPRPQLCEGKKVALNVIGVGTEIDMHNLHLDGQTLVAEKHSTASISVYPAIFVAGSFTPMTQGRWNIECMVQKHLEAGMQAQIDVIGCPANGQPKGAPHGGVDRKFCVGIDDINWEYESGEVYKKSKYVGYHCSQLPPVGSVMFGPAEPVRDDMGILGPVISGEVGDRVTVYLKNNGARDFSFHADGVRRPATITHTTPGNIGVYTFDIPTDALTDDDDACVTRPYYSDVDVIKDANTGLIGQILICKKDYLNQASKGSRATGSPPSKDDDSADKDDSGDAAAADDDEDEDDKDRVSIYRSKLNVVPDKRFFVLFSQFDESKSWYATDNTNAGRTLKEFHGINGKLAKNLNGLTMCVGDDVAWHLLGWGTETDLHTAYFYGNTFTSQGRRSDTQLLAPGQTATALMSAQNEGRWLLTCHTTDYIEDGMQALYEVAKCPTAGRGSPPSPQGTIHGKTRTYYIAIEEQSWEYCPRKTHPVDGTSLVDPDSEGYIFIVDNGDFIGSNYTKAIYVEYTDSNFSTKKTRTQADKHLGMNGPRIAANVGDTINIVLFNKASRPYSIQPHGVRYDKINEGSYYDDGAYTPLRIPVQSNSFRTYTWEVPIGSGPAANDPNCIPWLYMSANDQVKDIYSGLYGPLIICREGVLGDDGRRQDVDREFVMTFAVLDENQSNYIQTNVEQHATNRKYNDALLADGDFEESNLMHSINGFVYANNEGFEMIEGERVAWYVLSFGGIVDIHTAHWHGQTVTKDNIYKKRNDVFTITPGGNLAVEMVLDNPGTWLMHCHVHDHISAGMETVYTVLPKGSAIST